MELQLFDNYLTDPEDNKPFAMLTKTRSLGIRYKAEIADKRILEKNTRYKGRLYDLVTARSGTSQNKCLFALNKENDTVLNTTIPEGREIQVMETDLNNLVIAVCLSPELGSVQFISVIQNDKMEDFIVFNKDKIREVQDDYWKFVRDTDPQIPDLITQYLKTHNVL